MTTTADALVVTRATVQRGGRIVAHLRYSGRVVTVVRHRGATVGRLIPEGYLQGRTGSLCYEAWTAKHPMVPTPSDERLGDRIFTFEAGVRFLLERKSS